MAKKRSYAQLEKQLKISHDSADNFHAFFESSRDFLWVLDMEGRIIDCNQTVINRLGYPKKELIGQSVLKVHPEDQHVHAMEVINDILQGKAEVCPIPLKTEKGKLISVETRVVKGLWNKMEVLLGSSRDISELKMSEEKFEKAFHASPAIVALTDYRTGEFLDVNNQFYQTLGYSQKEIIGSSFTKIPLMEESGRKELSKTLKASGRVINLETCAISKSGERVPCLLSAEKIILDDEDYLFTTALSIKQLKETEQKLRKHQELLENMIAERTRKLELEVAQRHQAQIELSEKNILLGEKNIALRELLNQREKEKQEIREQVSIKVQRLILPLIERLKSTGTTKENVYLNALRDNLKDIITPLHKKAVQKMSVLTSRELEICNLIIQGCSSKEIAELLWLSVQTVHTHRKNIRKKFGIDKQNINLAKYLKAIK